MKAQSGYATLDLQTARCRLRPFAAEDIGAFMEYRNDEDWMRYQGFKGLGRQAYEKALLAAPRLEEGAQYAIASRATGGLIGDVYLRREGDTLWVGYTVAPAYARRGYAEEVMRAVAAWARQQGLLRLAAGVLPGNAASLGLLEKLGFGYVGEEDGEQVYKLPL